MGILNVTPDSFYSGSRHQHEETVVQKAEQMLADGATIIDIGGQSTRPGAEYLPASEEAARVLPAIEAVSKALPQAFISIDTFYAAVAKQAAEAGACIVNDISSGSLDSTMVDTVANLNVPYIIMHMQGTPQTMQQNPIYENVTLEVMDYLMGKAEECRLAGIKDIIIDLGFGFGKTIAHNFTLLKQLKVFEVLKKPILAGLSRKGTIYKTLSTTAEEALNGTTVLNTIALLNGASILRVHDVKEAAEAIKLIEAYQK
ncbi:dihydropteroate synthase [Aridibaculum aurantiacum]|uniref:dihydropteroate synthase n=1 Tax=Aridibaculum aurantiacum TaxID=2810307 RepID=UPI001F60BC84|nr:dihydropteroate synthase [Aridibaculum aurantiacum]